MTISIVLIRHAETQKLNSHPDFARSISETGRRIQHKMNLFLKRHQIIPDKIWHSPLARARQTAELIAEDFAIPTLSEQPFLADPFGEDSILENLADLPKNQCLFMVGHGPSLMRLATFFLGFSCLKAEPANSSAIVLHFQDTIGQNQAQLNRYYSPEDVLLENHI